MSQRTALDDRKGTSGTVEPSTDTQVAVKAAIVARGDVAVAADLMVGRATALRVAAGLPVRRGSLALIEQRLLAMAAPRAATGEAA